MSCSKIASNQIWNHYKAYPVKSIIVTGIILALLAGSSYLGCTYSRYFFLEFVPLLFLSGVLLHRISRGDFVKSKNPSSRDMPIDAKESIQPPAGDATEKVVLPSETPLSETPSNIQPTVIASAEKVSIPIQESLTRAQASAQAASFKKGTVRPIKSSSNEALERISRKETPPETGSGRLSSSSSSSSSSSGVSWDTNAFQPHTRPKKYLLFCKLSDFGLQVEVYRSMTVDAFKGRIAAAWNELPSGKGITPTQIRALICGREITTSAMIDELYNIGSPYILLAKELAALDKEYQIRIQNEPDENADGKMNRGKKGTAKMNYDDIDLLRELMESYVSRLQRGKINEKCPLLYSELLIIERKGAMAIKIFRDAVNKYPNDEKFQKQAKFYLLSLELLYNYVQKEVLDPCRAACDNVLAKLKTTCPLPNELLPIIIDYALKVTGPIQSPEPSPNVVPQVASAVQSSLPASLSSVGSASLPTVKEPTFPAYLRFGNKIVTLEGSANMTVETLLAQIAEKLNDQEYDEIRPKANEFVQLLFAGRQLEPNYTLGEYGFSTASTIHGVKRKVERD